MARRRRYQPIERIRRALLLVLIIFVGGIGGYYFLARVDDNGARNGDATDSEAPLEVTEGVLTVARGFDYEVTDGDELAYRVRADRLVSDIQDRMDLQQMEVELPQDQDSTVVVVSDRGSIDLDSKSATLEGSVRARSADGVELTGESFEVIRDGKQLVSRSPVEFSKSGEFRGSAESLHYSIKKERLTLEGDVVVQSEPADDPEAGTLRCQKLVYDRLEGTLRLEGDVRIERGLEFLEAARLSMTMDGEQNGLRFVRAEGGVKGRYLPEPSSADPASRIDFRGKMLYALFEEGTRQAQQAELRGRARQNAVLDMVDESGISRVVTAPILTADFTNGEVAMVDAREPVVLAERHSFAPGRLLRRVCAQVAHATFDDLGELETLTLSGNVDYQAPELQAQGDTIVAQGRHGDITIAGEPALVVTDRGDFRAPLINYAHAGRVVASDGVRAEFSEGDGYTLMGGESDEPIRVTADQAIWEESPEKVVFTGSVRAWQGDDYLLANEMVGEPDLDRLTATDNVKTVLKRESAGLTSSEEESAAGEPIEITAKKLIYEQPRRVITYEGDARAVQQARVVECQTMDVELDQDNEFERLVCTGDLLVEDPTQGKEVRGDEAIYVPGSDEVDITGDPVVLTDQDGTELRGGRIIYRFDTGAAQIRSRPLPEPGVPGEPG